MMDNADTYLDILEIKHIDWSQLIERVTYDVEYFRRGSICGTGLYTSIFTTFFLAHLESRIVELGQNKRKNLYCRFPLKVFYFSLSTCLYVSRNVSSQLISYSVIAAAPIVMKEAHYYSSIINSENPYRQFSDSITSLLGTDVTRRFILEQLLQYFLVNEGRLIKDFRKQL